MRVGKLSDMHRGWIIGNFEPSLFKTDQFEVGILLHPKGQIWPTHFHKLGTEYNILISGTMRLCEVELIPGDTFIVEPYEIAEPIFHEDCLIVCIKIPGNKDDKYLV